MFRRKWTVSLVAFVLAAWFPGTLVAETVSVPFGTRVFIELDQKVTSKKKHNRPGSFVAAHIWRDVVVNGQTVAKAGTPAMVQIGDIKPAKVAGIKGHVELKALHVTAVDGRDLMLTGGYDQSGKSLTALSVSLAVVVFVPLIFLKGKQAKLQAGTVFDAMVSQPTEVAIDDSKPVKIRLARSKPLTVTIPYEQLEGVEAEKEVKNLPLRITVEGDVIDAPRVIQVNHTAIEPIRISVGQASQEEEGYLTVDATVNLKALGKHFTQGFNNFTVDVGGHTQDVMLDLEL